MLVNLLEQLTALREPFYILYHCLLGFPCGAAGKESACNARDLGSIPELGRSLGEGKGYPFWYSGLENSMDSIVHGVEKSRTRLSDFHFHSFNRTRGLDPHVTTESSVCRSEGPPQPNE